MASDSEHDFDPTDGVVIFTDGSAYYKDRSGGWSYVLIDTNRNVLTASGHVDDTTISQMELCAPATALHWLGDKYGPCPLIAVYSDSEYVVLGCNDRTRKRSKNKAYWDSLDDAIALHEHVEFNHVKGHANHEYNELADTLAKEARIHE